jgi:hypothetical protein
VTLKKNSKRRRKKSTSENRKKKHFKKVTKLTCSLTKIAVRFHLKVLRPDTNQRTRRDAFLSFKNTVKDVLAQHSETATIMHEHPILPASLPSFANEAFAAFLNAHVNTAVTNLTSSVVQAPPDDEPIRNTSGSNPCPSTTLRITHARSQGHHKLCVSLSQPDASVF